jgi:asparagine synthetase B (glutamine-hydrolysing)
MRFFHQLVKLVTLEINWNNVIEKVVKGGLPFPKSCVQGLTRESVLDWDNVPSPTAGDPSMLSEIRRALQKVVSTNAIKQVGVWLSGGIDSSLLVALAAEVLGPENVTCYTLAFETTDESQWAQMAADHVGCRIIVEEMDFEENVQLFKDAVRNEMSPIASSTPVLKLARLCKKHGDRKVFSALGLDELCGGYPRHVKASDEGFQRVEQFFYEFCNYHYSWMQAMQCKNEVELYFPYLEPQLIAVCRGYPREYKTQGEETKVRIRHEIHTERLLPPEITERGRQVGSKEGFHPDVPTWWKQGLQDWIETNLPPHVPLGPKMRLWFARKRRPRNMWFLWRLASINPFLEVVNNL